MTKDPSIKGATLASVVEDVCALRDAGRISPEQLETMLTPEDLALLETKLQPALWYPIGSYGRLTELLLEREGRGNPQYLVDRGARAAERLWEGGLYVQLQHGEEKARAAREKGATLTERDARLVVSLAGALFNFMTWSYHAEGDESRVEVREAEPWPEVGVLSAKGFLEYTVSRLRDRDTRVLAERPSPDHVIFRFAR